MTRLTRLLGAATFSLLASCGGGSDGGGPPGPVAGDLTISYFQGVSEAGALLITISGGPVLSTTALGGQQISYASPYAGTTRIIVAGTLATGDLFKIHVPDLAASTSYTASILQVADKVTFALIEVASYSLTIHK
jgi:hypothetical protein